MPLTKSGYVSSKSAPGNKTWKRRLKMEKVVRLIAAGFSDIDIAVHLGVTPQYVSMLKRSEEFQAMNVEVMTGVISSFNGALRDVTETGIEELRSMVPTAMLALRDSLLDKNNPKLRFEAAKEVLDREGTLAKVSRSEVKVKEEFDFSKHDKISQDLLEALQANSIFNSNPSDTARDQMDAENLKIQEAFIQSGLTKEAQEELHKNINLNEFNPLPSSKVN